MGLEEGLAYVAGAGLLSSVLWLARIPLKALCDVWVENAKGKSARLLEQERRQTERELEQERRETQLAVIRARALLYEPEGEIALPSRRELSKPP